MASIRVSGGPAGTDLEASRDPFGDLGTDTERPPNGIGNGLSLTNATAILLVAGNMLLLWDSVQGVEVMLRAVLR